ncbi:MAG: flagellar basal body P-ring protein FlgI [Phycisphaerae bacterium]|nr:flagellar basal body P-ring protein FlgI [Phycisphaerae bacterium]MDW8262508.1 flagellar basal body P-ring protein FlgI [Phycisphaerales bacterium]
MARFIAVTMILGVLAAPAHAVKIADITRIGGQRTNLLTGLGLVYGLKGTGDGGDFQPAIKPLATMLSKFSNPATVRELQEVNNVALVSITATVPSNGVRDGDRIDVYVTSIGAASSLRGGRLFVTPLTGPIPGSGIFALAEGPIVIEDPATPTVGRIVGGAVMETDLPAKYVENGRFTLIVEDPSASWTTASTIARIINDAEDAGGEPLAVAIDPKNIVVNIPEMERDRPDSFISRIQRLPVPMLPSEARVTINDRTGTMIVTGDVEISPCVISHKGLTITTITPQPVGTPQQPLVTESTVVSLDTTASGGAKLQDLVNALDQLKVPAEDRIAIVKELHKIGKLHAKLIVEGT